MAPNKKKGARSGNNKKKNKGSKNVSSSSTASNPAVAGTSSTSSSSIKSIAAALTGSGLYTSSDPSENLRNMTQNTTLPTFHAPHPSAAATKLTSDGRTSSSSNGTTTRNRRKDATSSNGASKNNKRNRLKIRNNLLDGKTEGYYDVYKETTTNFCNWMNDALETIDCETKKIESIPVATTSLTDESNGQSHNDDNDYNDDDNNKVRTSKLRTMDDLWKAADQILRYNLKSLDLVEQLKATTDANKRSDSGTNPLSSTTVTSLLLPILVPRQILEDLTTILYFRRMVLETRYGGCFTGGLLRAGGDPSHRHILQSLQYCQSTLRYSRKVAIICIRDISAMLPNNNDDIDNSADKETKESRSDEQDGTDFLMDQFRRLTMDSSLELLGDNDLDNDDGDDDTKTIKSTKLTEEAIRNRQIPTTDVPETPKEEIDIQRELVNGDDTFQAAALIRTMNDLMGAIAAHYGLLKKVLRGKDPREKCNRASSSYDGKIVKLVMECAVVTNIATQTVRGAEKDLVDNHPHLSSFYHVVSLVCLPAFMKVIESMLDPHRIEKDPYLALNFVAEIVECR
jgi:hypothetical protein